MYIDIIIEFELTHMEKFSFLKQTIHLIVGIKGEVRLKTKFGPFFKS